MNMLKRILPDVVAILVFAVISFAYFCPAVTEGRILSQHDSVAGIGAGQEGKEYLERTGERTRWTNSIFGGMPTYQMAPSYRSTAAAPCRYTFDWSFVQRTHLVGGCSGFGKDLGYHNLGKGC